MNPYPREHFLPLENNPHLLLRVTINQLKESYSAEIDLLFLESNKIFHHIGMIYNESDPDEALYNAIQKASFFLSKK